VVQRAYAPGPPTESYFGRELHKLDTGHAGYRLHERITGERGRVTPAELDDLCADWREREGVPVWAGRAARGDERALEE